MSKNLEVALILAGCILGLFLSTAIISELKESPTESSGIETYMNCPDIDKLSQKAADGIKLTVEEGERFFECYVTKPPYEIN